jgi:hypothetical protein
MSALPAGQPVLRGPYETRRQASTDVAGIYEKARHSTRREVIGEENQALLEDACQNAGVILGAYDARILSWLAGYEPEMCAVVADLVSRAHAAGRASADAGPLLDEDSAAGRHAICPGRLCQCPECPHGLWRSL